MNDSIFIPKKIRVGFQKRTDTYTNKLAYVIYYDQKGKLRKQASWDSWRDQKISPEEFENVPTEGFVLNKKVGGYKYHWDARQTYVRVYDPRGFEFEITIPNLLYILEHTSSIKGKGLEGEFVYGWDGAALVLLPTSSPDYQELMKLNSKRFDSVKIGAKNLIPGYEYLGVNNKKYVYMGCFDAYEDMYFFDGKQFQTNKSLEKYARENDMPLNDDTGWYKYYPYSRNNPRYTYGPGCVGKRHFFYCEEEYKSFKYWKSVNGKILDVTSIGPVPNFPELMEKLECSTIFSPYDPSKDQLVEMTPDEIKTRFASIPYFYDRKFLTLLSDGTIAEIQVTKISDEDKYICDFTYHSSERDMSKYFKFEHQFARADRMVPVDLDEILNKFKPYYINMYLKNSKFLGKRYEYD